MFVNLPNNLSSPIINQKDLKRNSSNPDYGDSQTNNSRERIYDDSMIDLQEMQNFLFMMLKSKVNDESVEIRDKHSVDLFV